MDFEVQFYFNPRGDMPVEEFLESLDQKSLEKVLAAINRLEQEGNMLFRPFADAVRGRIRELRIQFGSDEYRILFFFFQRTEIILLHGFRKKTQKLEESDIEKAEERMADWEARFG